MLTAMSWRLTYDPTIATALKAAIISADQSPAEGEQSDVKPGNKTARSSYNGQNKKYSLDRPGVLAHEICHKYANLAFESKWHKQRVLPDMLDEVAAISCESSQLRNERLVEFYKHMSKGASIPWNQFLSTKHPLKSGMAIDQAIQYLQVPGRSTITFTLESSSPYASKAAILYSQAALFAEYLRAKSCSGNLALGRLLISYDPTRGLDAWLRAYGRQMCLPSSAADLERSMLQFVRERQPARRAKDVQMRGVQSL